MMSIWAVLEHHRTQFHEQSAELLGELMGIVQRQQAPAELCAVVLAASKDDSLERNASLLARFGVQRMYWLEHEALEVYGTGSYVAALTWLIRRSKPGLIVTSATPRGQDWAPRLAARLHLPFVANCLGCSLQNDVLWSLQPLYEGRAYVQSNMILQGRSAIITLLPGVRGESPASSHPVVTMETVHLVPELNGIEEQRRVRSLGVQAPSPEEIELEAAERIVAGGRGIGREGFAALAAFAHQVGAAVGATRVATDLGWVERERQIGATGKTVRPVLYIACGISGAAQHTSGMSTAQTVIAINPDRSAPIFALADLGLLGDANQILLQATQLLQDQET